MMNGFVQTGNGGMKRMIVIEREALARWVRELKQRLTRDDGVDYYTAYLSALTAVEAYMAVMPEYDLRELAEAEHPGLFTPEEVCMKMVEHGQGNYKRFKLGDTIQYSPTEVMKILKDELPKAL